VFLHYLAKQTNTKIVFFTQCHDYSITNFKNTLCMDCQFHSVIETAYTRCLKYPPFVRTHAYRRFLHSLTVVSTTLCCRPLQTSTSRCLSSSTLWICISYTRCCMTPKSCNQRGSGPDCWGPYSSAEMKSGCFTLQEFDCVTRPMRRCAVLLNKKLSYRRALLVNSCYVSQVM